VKAWAERFYDKKHALFLGRGMHYPIAMEGAQAKGNYISMPRLMPGELKHIRLLGGQGYARGRHRP
jgi:glucosamine--fructose-6-phosphate aminotransferase (isomerizing)